MTEPTPVFAEIEKASDLLCDMATATRAQVVRTSMTENREPIDELVRYSVLHRDRFRCVWCNTRWHLEIDHIIPWSAGGSDDIENLRTLCHDCNTTRSNRLSVLDVESRLPMTRHGCLRCEGGDRTSDMTEVYCRRCRRRSIGVPAGDRKAIR